MVDSGNSNQGMSGGMKSDVGYSDTRSSSSSSQSSSSQSSGFDLNGLTDRVFAATSDFGSSIIDRAKDLPNLSKDLAGKVDRSARSNPWMHIGIAGAGAFAIGYLLGRGMTSSSTEVKGLAEEMDDEV